jgi:hypothetical protein
MRRVANKKAPLSNGADAEILSMLSKAALLDLLVETLRRAEGACDTEIAPDLLAELCNPTLIERGDKPLRIGGSR